MIRPVGLALFLVTLLASSPVVGAPIDFSDLDGADLADANGQDFAWTAGSRMGTVNVRASWPNVTSVDGALRTPVRTPASFDNPFMGTVTFTFDAPVEVAFLSTFASLTRDGLSGGRFEQVSLASPDAVHFQPAADTTAIYGGVGGNTITADDEFSETPTLSNWGFVGRGSSAVYEFRYVGTTGGFSETFNVSVVPEPDATLLLAAGIAFLATCLIVRTFRSNRSLCVSRAV